MATLLGCGDDTTINPAELEVIVVDRRPLPHHGVYLIKNNERQTLFAAEPLGHLLQITYSATLARCVFAYAPPPVAGQTSNLSASLYSMPVSPGAQPEVLIPAGRNEVLLDPVFSHDSSQLYWVRAVAPTNPRDPTKLELNVTNLEDMSYATVLRNAIWPAPSIDGARLAFVTVNPATLQRGLSVRDNKTGNVTELIEIGRFDDIDAPIFSTDGRWIYFFGPALTQSVSDGWLRWLGIQTAHAHINRPGVWWKIAVDGNNLQTITDENEIISNASRADSGILTYTSSLGVRLLTEDGIMTLAAEPYFGGVAEHVR
ncbi:MAG: hypothetical protein AAF993_10095 [Pseudomonadota bacterium]